MNFFKSVLPDDPDSPKADSEPKSPTKTPQNEERNDPDPKSPPNTNADRHSFGGWSFGGLIKTITTKSESVIETYRRDLQEFGSGLRKEIEVAHGSLETVGTVIDEFGNTVLKGTAQIISQGKDAILAADHESDSSDNNQTYTTLNSRQYSRFDAHVRAIKGDISTYCEEPDDLDDYHKWKLGFILEEKSNEIEGLIEENESIDGIYKKVVPNKVDSETFWCRYFYRVHKLKQAEDLRANLVKRAISTEEEELSWDVDDDEEEKNIGTTSGLKGKAMKNKEVGSEEFDGKIAKNVVSKADDRVGEKSKNVQNIGNVGEEGKVVLKAELPANQDLSGKESKQVVNKESSAKESQVGSFNKDSASKTSIEKLSGDKEPEKKNVKEGAPGISKKDPDTKSDEKVASRKDKAGHSESFKDSDIAVVSTQPSVPEEEDLEWDEIEDLSSIDEKKMTHGGSPNKADLRKRLSAAEEDEDLSWDVEDEDESAKA